MSFFRYIGNHSTFLFSKKLMGGAQKILKQYSGHIKEIEGEL